MMTAIVQLVLVEVEHPHWATALLLLGGRARWPWGSSEAEWELAGKVGDRGTVVRGSR
jgi:hypothetical protein